MQSLRHLLEKRYVMVLAGDVIPVLSPLAVVPPREEGQGILLGVDDKGRNIYLNPYSLPNVHGVILGTSGSGKSTLSRHIILEARDKGVKAWVIDPHGEEAYKRLFDNSIKMTVDKINILSIPGWSHEEYASELSRYIELIYAYYGSRNVIRKLILRCLKEGSLSPMEKFVDEDPDISRLYDDLIRIHGDAPTIAELSDRDIYFYFPTMVSQEIGRLSIQVLLLLLQGYRRSQGVKKRLEQIIILEEAHLFSKYLLSLYKEIRKWGYSLIAISQLPREFDIRLYQLAGFVLVLSGSESYIRDIAALFSITNDEKDHVLFASRGTALFFRQGDPRPRKVFLRIREEAFS
ncbi:MAG: helicase HerA domain-containing protein [Infirmifilum sp.]